MDQLVFQSDVMQKWTATAPYLQEGAGLNLLNKSLNYQTKYNLPDNMTGLNQSYYHYLRLDKTRIQTANCFYIFHLTRGQIFCQGPTSLQTHKLSQTQLV